MKREYEEWNEGYRSGYEMASEKLGIEIDKLKTEIAVLSSNLEGEYNRHKRMWEELIKQRNEVISFLDEAIDYARSRPRGERGWKTWLKKVEESSIKHLIKQK